MKFTCRKCGNTHDFIFDEIHELNTDDYYLRVRCADCNNIVTIMHDMENIIEVDQSCFTLDKYKGDYLLVLYKADDFIVPITIHWDEGINKWVCYDLGNDSYTPVDLERILSIKCKIDF